MRLRSSLLLLAIAAVAPLVLFCAIAAWLLFDRESDSLVHTALARNRATIGTIDTKLLSSIDALRALSASRSLARDDLASFHADAKAVLASQEGWQNVLLSAPDGVQLVNARLPWGTPLIRHLVEPESFRKAISTGDPAVGNISFAPRLRGQPGVTVRLPVGRDGTVKYVLTAVLSPAVFQQVLEDQRLPPGAMTGVVGTDGRLIARLPRVPPGTQASSDYAAYTTAKSEGWFRGRTLEGTETYTAFSRSELTGWSIAYAIPSDAVLGGMKRAASAILAGLAASLAAALLIAAWMGRIISAPIAALAAAAEALPEPTPPLHARTRLIELQQLSRALDRTGRRLRTRDEELRQTHEALHRQAQDLQAAAENKSRFLALLAHELRNPLAPLRTGLRLLSDTADPQRRALIEAMMERQIRTLARLIEDLVDMSRIDRGQLELRRERLDLNELVLQAVEMAMPGIEAKRQLLSTHCTGAPLCVHADGIRLIQLVSNLLNNASKYTPEKGAIDLLVSQHEGMAVVTVRDTGIGFSSADAERMFGMFVRLDEGRVRNDDGLGIGLTIAQAFATQHGGSLVAHSEGPGQGAVFTLSIPLCSDEVGQDLTPAPAPASAAPGRRVLVADDNRDAAETMAELLRTEGFEVACAYDGRQAMAAARAHPPDVAFLDLDMPGLSGLEVARQLRAKFGRAIRLVAITGLGRAQLNGGLEEADFDVHLTKPADPAELLRIAAGTR